MTLHLQVCGVLDDSLGVMYDTESSSGRSDGANVSIVFTFPFSISQAAVSQTLLRHMYSVRVVGCIGGAYWRHVSIVASSELNRTLEVTMHDKNWSGLSVGVSR